MHLFCRIRIALCIATIAVAAAACSIYDDIDNIPTEAASGNAYSYVDATSYTTWIYFDLLGGGYTALPYDDTDHLPSAWTFALHRYDCKTHDGGAVETPFSSLAALLSAIENGAYRLPAADEFIGDELGEINIDMSTMMDGYIITAEAMVNKELSKWLDVDISTMPPIYTPSNKVYLLLTADGTYIAILFTGFTNPYYYDAKGYISFEYSLL